MCRSTPSCRVAWLWNERCRTDAKMRLVKITTRPKAETQAEVKGLRQQIAGCKVVAEALTRTNDELRATMYEATRLLFLARHPVKP